MNANRTTSAHNIADSWGCDGFIKARNSHITGDATLRIGLASILSNTENCLFRQKRGSAFWLNGRTNLHNKIIGFNGTYLDINGPICKDIFSRLPVFVRIFYAKIRMALTLPGLLRGGAIKHSNWGESQDHHYIQLSEVDTHEIKLERERFHQECAILWFNEISTKTWLIVGPISVENQIHLEHVSPPPRPVGSSEFLPSTKSSAVYRGSRVGKACSSRLWQSKV